MISALGYMFALDISRAFRVARLRRHALGFGDKVTTLGGFLRTGNREVERAVGRRSRGRCSNQANSLP